MAARLLALAASVLLAAAPLQARDARDPEDPGPREIRQEEPAPPEPINRLSRPEPPRPPVNRLSRPSPARAPEPRFATVQRQAGAGSALRVSLDHSLHSAVSRQGDAVEALLAEPLRDSDGRVVLPAGTRLEGRVGLARKGRSFGRGARMELGFSRAELPDGRRIALAAAASLRAEKGRRAGSGVGVHVRGGGGCGRTSSAEVAAATAVVSGFQLLGRRGQELSLARGAELELVLAESLSVERAVELAAGPERPGDARLSRLVTRKSAD